MSSPVFDDFTTVQGPDTTIIANTYTPAGSRQLSRDGGNIFTDGNVLSVSLPNTIHAFVRYTYDVPENFSLIDVISLDIPALTGEFSIQLQLTDANSQVEGGTVFNLTGPQVISWPMSEFTTLNLNQIERLTIVFVGLTSGESFLNADKLFSTLVCVARNTRILMASGVEKEIQKIRRGDLVMGDTDGSIIHKVARVHTIPLGGKQYIDVLLIKKGSLCDNIPSRDLIITKNHPIVYCDARRPAKCLSNLNGVCYYRKEDKEIKVEDILTKGEKEPFYTLYDLQFDHDGTYVANGLVVQSRSPYSDLTPLPKELYFDLKHWKNVKTWDSVDHTLPLSFEILSKIHKAEEENKKTNDRVLRITDK